MNSLKDLIAETFTPLYSDRKIPYDRLLTNGIELGFIDIEAMAELLRLHNLNVDSIDKSILGKPLWHPAEIYITCMQVQDLRKIKTHGEYLAQKYYDLLFDASLTLEFNPEQVQALRDCRFDYTNQAKKFLKDNVSHDTEPFVLKSFLLRGKSLTNDDFYIEFWHKVAPQGVLYHADLFLYEFFRGKTIGEPDHMTKLLAGIMF